MYANGQKSIESLLIIIAPFKINRISQRLSCRVVGWLKVLQTQCANHYFLLPLRAHWVFYGRNCVASRKTLRLVMHDAAQFCPPVFVESFKLPN